MTVAQFRLTADTKLTQAARREADSRNSFSDLPAVKVNATSKQLVQLLDKHGAKIYDSSGARLNEAIAKYEALWLIKIARHPAANWEVAQRILTLTDPTVYGPRRDAEALGWTAFRNQMQKDFDDWKAQSEALINPGGTDLPGGVQPPDVDVVGATRLDPNRRIGASEWKVKVDQAAALFGRPQALTRSAEDLYRTFLPLSQTADPNKRSDFLALDTNLPVGGKVEVAPYDNTWGIDQPWVKDLEVGEVLVLVKGHKPEHPILAGEAGKEAVKFDSSHISIGVVVKKEDGGKGVMTINNPQEYPDFGPNSGLFGDEKYGSIALRIKLPAELSPKERLAYMDNIRTWLIIANTFSSFASDYNGGDNLKLVDQARVKEISDKLLEATTGLPADAAPGTQPSDAVKTAAMEWLKDGNNELYCAELLHAAMNLGLEVPLNKKHLGEPVFNALDAIFKDKALRAIMLEKNANVRAPLVDLTTAPGGMLPLRERMHIEMQQADVARGRHFGNTLAMPPVTMPQLLEEFVQVIDRERYTQAGKEAEAAALQSTLFKGTIPSLLTQLGVGQLPESDPRRQAVVGLLEKVQAEIAKAHGSYREFRAAIDPLLERAHQMAGPGANGENAFFSPHVPLLYATGRLPQGNNLIKVEPYRVLLHNSVVERKTQ